MRYPGLCEFHISNDLSRIIWKMDPASGEGFVSILLSGTVLALVMILRGDLVLHASAVEVEGHALAFVGAAGQGKSTMAVLVAAERGTFLSDDVLRIEFDSGTAFCHPSATEARLREGASLLAEGAATARTTADGRTAFGLRQSAGERVPLRAIVVPYRTTQEQPYLVEQAKPSLAHFLVSSFPRVLGFEDPNNAGRQFELVADLVGRVPVYRVRLPVGPPFPPGLVGDLLRDVGWSEA